MCVENNCAPIILRLFRSATCQLESRRANDNAELCRSTQQKRAPRISQTCILEIFLPSQIDRQCAIDISTSRYSNDSIRRFVCYPALSISKWQANYVFVKNSKHGAGICARVPATRLRSVRKYRAAVIITRILSRLDCLDYKNGTLEISAIWIQLIWLLRFVHNNFATNYRHDNYQTQTAFYISADICRDYTWQNNTMAREAALATCSILATQMTTRRPVACTPRKQTLGPWNFQRILK